MKWVAVLIDCLQSIQVLISSWIQCLSGCECQSQRFHRIHSKRKDIQLLTLNALTVVLRAKTQSMVSIAKTWSSHWSKTCHSHPRSENCSLQPKLIASHQRLRHQSPHLTILRVVVVVSDGRWSPMNRWRHFACSNCSLTAKLWPNRSNRANWPAWAPSVMRTQFGPNWANYLQFWWSVWPPVAEVIDSGAKRSVFLCAEESD